MVRWRDGISEESEFLGQIAEARAMTRDADVVSVLFREGGLTWAQSDQ